MLRIKSDSMVSCENTKNSVVLRLDSKLRQLLTHGNSPSAEIIFPLRRRASIKDILESIGIPHTEIHRILTAGQELSFSYIPEGGEILDIHSPDGPIDVTLASVLRPEPFPGPAFIVDISTGKLARLLRMAGIDTWYEPDIDQAELSRKAIEARRIVLSRSRSLLMRKEIMWGHLVRSQKPADQFKEVWRLFGLQDHARPFSRCMECNSLLDKVDKELIMHRLKPLTKRYYDLFYICPTCKRIYWQGSHFNRMNRLLQEVAGSANFNASCPNRPTHRSVKSL